MVFRCYFQQDVKTVSGHVSGHKTRLSFFFFDKMLGQLSATFVSTEPVARIKCWQITFRQTTNMFTL